MAMHENMMVRTRLMMTAMKAVDRRNQPDVLGGNDLEGRKHGCGRMEEACAVLWRKKKDVPPSEPAILGNVRFSSPASVRNEDTKSRGMTGRSGNDSEICRGKIRRQRKSRQADDGCADIHR